jgi:hypothetical protein
MAAMKQLSLGFLIVFTLFMTVSASAQAMVRRGPGKGQSIRLMKRTETNSPMPATPSVGRINIRVVWSEIFGLPPSNAGASEVSPCGSFEVSVYNIREKVRSGEVGTFGTERADGVERYVCTYSIEALPKGEQLAVIASFPDSRDLEVIPWISVRGTDGAMPGIGQERVLSGARIITLTDEVAVANIAFRVQYETPKVSEIY